MGFMANWVAQDARRARPYTTALLDMVDQGVMDKDMLIRDLVGWMSEQDVKEFVLRNDYLQDLVDQDDE